MDTQHSTLFMCLYSAMVANHSSHSLAFVGPVPSTLQDTSLSVSMAMESKSHIDDLSHDGHVNIM